MTQNEIDIVKKCAAIVARSYDLNEPWMSPNKILRSFGLPDWEYCDGYWLDSETGINYHFGG
jgi:hypothetical protein